MFLNTKIPPPIVAILFAVMIFYFSDSFAHVDLPFKIYISLSFVLLGFFITFSSARNFKKKETTVNPIKPEEASQLVTDGFFKITRNPMYLGMLLFLLGLSIYNGLIVGLVFDVKLEYYSILVNILFTFLFYIIFSGLFDYYQKIIFGAQNV